MRKFLSSFIFCVILLVLSGILPLNATWALSNPLNTYSPLSAIFHFEGAMPNNLGVKDGKFSPCPSTPNCVISEETDAIHEIKPITYDTDLNTAKETLLKVLSVVPNTIIVEETDNYIRTESRSKLMGFVDDGEFYFPSDEKVILIRSSARLGESDLGVNRRRLEQIRLAMEDLGA